MQAIPCGRNVSKRWGKCCIYPRKVNRRRGPAWALVYDCPCGWHSPWSGFGRDSSILPDSGQGQPRGWYEPGTANSRSLNADSLFQRLELFCPPLASGTHSLIYSPVQMLLMLLQRRGLFLCVPSTLIFICPVSEEERVIAAILVRFSESLVVKFCVTNLWKVSLHGAVGCLFQNLAMAGGGPCT